MLPGPAACVVDLALVIGIAAFRLFSMASIALFGSRSTVWHPRYRG